jgi:hypothetical protein
MNVGQRLLTEALLEVHSERAPVHDRHTDTSE